MVQITKAMTAEDRIMSAVLDIKDIKDRKGTASNDAVRVILKKMVDSSGFKNCYHFKGICM